jgi:hypothetical protein
MRAVMITFPTKGEGVMTSGRLRAGLLTACVAITLASSATATAADKYYVSPDGNNAADGRSQKSAWRTLDRVNRHTFAAGDRIFLSAGDVHPGSIRLGPENSAGDIEIGSYGKGRAVIDAGYTTSSGDPTTTTPSATTPRSATAR